MWLRAAKCLFQIVIAAALILAFVVRAFANEDEDAQQLESFRRMVDRTVLSCDTLVVLDYKILEEGFSFAVSGAAQQVNIDLASCRTNLGEIGFGNALGPFIDLMGSESADANPPEYPLTEEELKRLQKESNAASLKAALAVKAQLNSYVDYCRIVEPKPAKGLSRACYFGAYAPKASGPARAAFEAMAHGTLGGEALCTANPIEREKPHPPEFTEFLGREASLMGWKSIRKALTADGFTCEKGQRSDGCSKWVMAVHLGAVDAKDVENSVGLYGNAYITPRVLSVYNGDWQTAGFTSAGDKPKRGTKTGICMVPEDWHTFLGAPLLLNSPAIPD